MAFNQDYLAPVQVSSGKAPNQWIYMTTDAHAVVDSAGYFDNGSTLNTGMRNVMKIGDVITVVVVDALDVPTTVSTYGTHIVLSNAAGVIDVSNVTVGVVTDTD